MEYQTLFIAAEIIKKAMAMVCKPNGDQLARDIQAALLEKTAQGYELVSTTPIDGNHQSSYPHTIGVLLIFKKAA